VNPELRVGHELRLVANEPLRSLKVRRSLLLGVWAAPVPFAPDHLRNHWGLTLILDTRMEVFPPKPHWFPRWLGVKETGAAQTPKTNDVIHRYVAAAQVRCSDMERRAWAATRAGLLAVPCPGHCRVMGPVVVSVEGSRSCF
jgi:hypothetical protein